MKTHRLPANRARTSAGRWLPSLLVAVTLCLVWYGGEYTGLVGRLGDGQGQLATVATDALNLRTGPSTSATVITVLGSGDEVRITGPAEGQFVPVSSGGSSGWVAQEYLSDRPPTGSDGGVQEVQAAEVASEDVNVPAEEQDTTDPAVVPAVEPTNQPPAVSLERWIRIDRSDATVSLMRGEAVIDVFSGRIGRDPSVDGFYSTAVGTYHVYSKNKGLAPTPFAEDTWLTDWVGFDPVRKNGIHSPVRESDGTIREWQNETTLGCVRLGAEDAVTVFGFAELGMRVEVVE